MYKYLSPSPPTSALNGVGNGFGRDSGGDAILAAQLNQAEHALFWGMKAFF